MGYLNKELSSEDKQEPLELIEDYRQELVPLIVPLTLLLRPSATYGGTRCRLPLAATEGRARGSGCGTPRVGRHAAAAGPKESMYS